MKTYTAVVADDEENLRKGTAMLLEKLWPELKIVGRAGNGLEALDMIEKEKPDVAFLDIRMPGMTGVAVAGKVFSFCKVVFITAFDQYAVEAFESEAVDYILKPVTQERLQTTIDRLKKYFDAGTKHESSDQNIQKAIKILNNRQAPDYLRLIKVKTGNDIRFVPVSEVVYFKAEDKYTIVRTSGHEYLIKTPIKKLETRLDPDTFWRVHRNAVVNINRIKLIRRSFTNRMVITFDSVDQTISVSRSYEGRFKHM